MFFIKIDSDISLTLLNAIGEIKMVAMLNTFTNLPEMFIEYKKVKFLMNFGIDEDLLNSFNYNKGVVNGDSNNISFYVDDKYYVQAASLMQLLNIHRIRSFMVKLEGTV